MSTASYGTLAGTVTNAATAAPLSGVLVQASGYSTVTNGAGVYSMSVAAGTHTVSASKAGFGTASATGVVVAASGTTQSFSLGTGANAGVVAGCRRPPSRSRRRSSRPREGPTS